MLTTDLQYRQDRAAALAKAKALVDHALADDRDLTADEERAVKAAMSRVEELDRDRSKARARKGSDLVRQVMSLGGEPDWENPEGGRGPFTAEAKAGLIRAVKTRTTYRTEVDRKALTSGTLLPSSGIAVQSGEYPGAVVALADLFANAPADGPVQRYYRMTAGTANVVAEGAPKPDSGTAITGHDVALRKVVALAKVSDELSEDAPYLLNALAADLQAAVAARENAEIVGAFNTSGISTLTGLAADDVVLDLVGSAIATQQSLSGITPAAVIAHPNQVAAIRAMKAETAGTYHVDPWSAGPPSLYGLQLVSTPAVAAGTIWVVSGQAMVVYRRGPVTVEMGHDGSDFSTNMRTVIAEERMAPAVVRPSGITRITLT